MIKKIIILTGVILALCSSIILYKAIPLFSYNDIVNSTNEYRHNNGVHKLIPSKDLDKIADIVLERILSKSKNKIELKDISTLVGYDSKNINRVVVGNVSDITSAIKNIKKSKSHNKLILADRFVHLGNSYSQSKKMVVLILGIPKRK